MSTRQSPRKRAASPIKSTAPAAAATQTETASDSNDVVVAPVAKRGRARVSTGDSEEGSAPSKSPARKGGARAEDDVGEVDESDTALPSPARASDVHIMTFNVNGLRAAVKNKLMPFLKARAPRPDAVMLQEVKGTEAQFVGVREGMATLGYAVHYNCGTTAGYAGTALLVRKDGRLGKPLRVSCTDSLAPRPFDADNRAKPPAANLARVPAIAHETGCEGLEPNAAAPDVSAAAYAEAWAINASEGRVITVEYPAFFLVGTYVPNAGDKLERLHFRARVWEAAMREYLNRLQEAKPVVWCGDLNVAHRPIDLHSPSTNHKYVTLRYPHFSRYILLFTMRWLLIFAFISCRSDGYSVVSCTMFCVFSLS